MATAGMTRGPGLHRVSQQARQVATHPWAKGLARLGYAAKGVVYALIGVLALRLAVGEGGRATDSKGAIASLADEPFGAVLLSLLAVGLVGFVAWRFAQAFADVEGKGTRGKGLATRAMYLLSGGIYTALALFTAKLVVGGAERGGGGTQSWTARLMDAPFGRVLVALVGVGIVGYAVKQLHTAMKATFLRKLSLEGLAARNRREVEHICRFGIAARGVVFALIGGFLVRAAVDANPGEAKGLGEALSTLSRQPFGDVLLGVVAAGLVAYAAYLFLEARYRRLPAAA